MSEYPNLDSGYAIVSAETNHWRAEVRSILCRTATSEMASLTHECRGENVESTNIFDGSIYEFAAIKTWLGNYSIYSGSHNYGCSNALSERACHLDDRLRIEIDCPLTNVHEFCFDEALKRLRNPVSGRYFIKVNYLYRGESWVIYAPARFINFPEAETEHQYLQPISGYTLFYNGERFVITYVVAHIKKEACHIEFISREPLPFMETKAKSSRLRKWLQPFSPITKRFLQTDEFWKIYVVEGDVVIYQYE